MKINVEFSSLSDMANFTKFINDSLVPPTQKQKTINEAQSEVKELRAELEKYRHIAEDNKRLNELLDRAYMRLQKADPKGETANMKSTKEYNKKDFSKWANEVLSTRLVHCLIADNINSFEELCGKTENQILSIPNLGRGSFRELVAALKEINMSLKK